MQETDENVKKFIIIDGNGLAYRAFYALPPLKTSRGEPMNAVYGFTNMLYQIMEDEKPDFLAVAFDKSKPTKRIEQFDEYKAHRQKMPEELQKQFPFIEEVVNTLKISIFWKEGYEADDCIATLTESAEKAGLFTKIYSGDLDMLQLVSPNTRVVTTRRGISDLVVYDHEMVRKRYGINPPQLVDYKALAGDSSDHIPGIPGIGEASASKLLNQFDRIETMYEKPDDIPSRWKKQIIENRDQAFLSKKLASLDKDLDLDFTWEDLRHKEPEREELKRLFIKLEFKYMLTKLGFTEDELEEIQEITVLIVGKDEDLVAMVDKLKTGKAYSMIWMAEDAQLIGLAIAQGKTNGFYFPFMLPEHLNISSTFGISTFSKDRIFHELKPLTDNVAVQKFVYDLKSGIPFIKRGEYFTGKGFIDVAVAAYLLEPDAPPKKLETILSRYTNFLPKTLEDIMNQKKSRKKMKIIEVPLQDLTLFTAGRAVRVNKMGPDLLKKLEEEDMLTTFNEIEMPLVTVLAAMEGRGVKIDKNILKMETRKLEREIEVIALEIFQLAGHSFNINSSRQLGKVLFEELKLPGGKKTNTGYRTGAEVLDRTDVDHPIVEKILKYREISKLKSTYADSILNQVDPNTDKIHVHFHQNTNPLGRLTTSSPGFHNAPDFLSAILIPSDAERSFLRAEFCDLEFRLLAHLAGDEKLTKIFLDKKDFLTEMAALLFKPAEGEMTDKMKSDANEIVWNIINGVSAHGLSQTLSIKRNEAKDLLNEFFAHFPGVQQYTERVMEGARKDEFILSLLGRKRYLPNINSQNKNMRSMSEKIAISTPILAGAADVIKKSLVDIFEGIVRNHRDIHILLQIDNEILFETKKRRLEKYSLEIKRVLENTIKLEVPLEVKISQGTNFLELRSKVC